VAVVQPQALLASGFELHAAVWLAVMPGPAHAVQFWGPGLETEYLTPDSRDQETQLRIRSSTKGVTTCCAGCWERCIAATRA
jgi:hypothetical protein